MIRRVLIRTAGIVLVLALCVVLAFRLSPWPSVAVIQAVFAEGDRRSEAALAAHVPEGIVTRADLAYGEGPDEVFDLNRPGAADGPLPAIVWVHGGAWIAGSKAGVANYLKVLAGHGYVTVGLEYSTGPGTRYPRPVEQVNAALGHLHEQAGSLGIDPGAIVLAGDSAGAQIAAQVALIASDPDYARRLGIAASPGTARIRAVVLVSGAFDLDAIGLDGEYGWFVRSVLWAYSGTRDFLADPRFALASIPAHVTPAFPPAFVTSGNGDPLAPQARRLVRSLEGAGVRVESLFFPGDLAPALAHEYQFDLDSEHGREALARMLGFVGSVVGP